MCGTQPYTNASLRKLGIQSSYRENGKKGTQRKIDLVIDHIKKYGGWVCSAINKIGIK